MEISSHYASPPHRCSYLNDQTALLEYVECSELSALEYGYLLEQGWRRFGRSLFRPRCPSCTACWSLRVIVEDFEMDRSQRRNAKDNEGRVTLQIGTPSVTPQKLILHDSFHSHQSEQVGWPRFPPKDIESYESSFVNNPIPTEEWRYFDKDKLIGVGYVDVVPQGLSAIYYFHDPAYRDWGLGTWNVLNIVHEARKRKCLFVYLGYFVSGCRSLEYKARYKPNEVLAPSGSWKSLELAG